jgi:hypothetical protein
LTAYRPRTAIEYTQVPAKHLTVIIFQGDEEKLEGAFSRLEWNQIFELWAIVINDDTATTAIDTQINQVKADIQKKLMADPTRGGYAIDTILLPSERIGDGESTTGINVRIAVHYRVQETDPYNK